MLAFVIVLSMFAVNVLTPGASFVLTLSNAMSHGRKSGYMVALGLATADTMFALAATLGLAALVSQSSLLIRCISIFGGLWLMYGGVRLVLRGKGVKLQQEADGTAGSLSPSLAFRLGFTTGALNAQAIIFFATLFVTGLAQEPSLLGSMGLVAGVALVSATARCGLVRVFTVDVMRTHYVAHQRKAEAVAGSVLTAFGVKLAVVPAAALLQFS